jgi:hypothetical protein
MPGRHPDVNDRQLRPGRTDLGQQFDTVAGLADDIEPGTIEQTSQAFTQQNVVVGEHDPGCAPVLRRFGCLW